MKHLTVKISSSILAFLVLFSTLSFAVEKHFCHDFLVDVSYFGNSKGCGESNKSCDLPSVVEENNCCKDEITKIDGQDEIRKSSFEDLDFETQKFVVSFAISYLNLYKELHDKVIPHKNYYPPNLTFNFQTLFEIFIL